MFYMISIDLGVSGATMGGRKTMQTLSQKVNKLLWVLVKVTNRWPLDFFVQDFGENLDTLR